MPRGTKKSIITEIKKLHKNREPLNITAMRRRHPKLLDAVYQFKRFWGWKQALEDAGIAYKDIRVDLQDYVVCEICGAEVANVATHLVAHGVTASDYLIDYPDSDLLNEASRASRSKMKSHLIPHWEPLWTREYVLDRIAEFDRQGFPLHEGWVKRNESALGNAAKRYNGGWRTALKDVGLDPAEVTRKGYLLLRQYQDKESVIRAIRKRRKNKLPLNLSEVYNGETDRDLPLVLSGQDYFGSWDDALRAADLKPVEIRIHKVNPYQSKTACIREICNRRKMNLALNAAAVQSGEYSDLVLYKASNKLFGSWDNALQAAKLNPEEIRKHQVNPYVNKSACIQEIRRRREKGWKLNGGELVNGKYSDILLHQHSIRLFGSWDDALHAAGLNPSNIKPPRKRIYPDKSACIREIRRRQNKGWKLNAAALNNGKHPNVSLYIYGRKYFGSWNNALRAAGVDPTKITLRRNNPYPDKSACIREIQQRHTKGWKLNAAALNKGKYPNASLHIYGRKYFGSWNKALRAAGLDPLKIENQRRRTYPDKSACIQEIRRRRKKGWKLNAGDLHRGKHPDKTLYKCGQEYFGSWDNALRVAGLDPLNIKNPRKLTYPDKAACVYAIQQRHKKGRKLNAAALSSKGTHPDVTLCKRARKLFGSWDNALRAAGLDPAQIRKRKTNPYVNSAACIREIKQRRKKGWKLNVNALDRGEHSDETLYRHAINLFGSWDNALRAAGLDPLKIKNPRKRSYPDKSACIQEIRRRRKKGWELNAAALLSGKHSDKALYKCGQEYFGSWDKALRAAGLNPLKIKNQRKQTYPDKSACIRAIQQRHRKGRKLNSSALSSNGTHPDVTLCKRARKLFGSWDNALRAAGLDPAKIRLR